MQGFLTIPIISWRLWLRCFIGQSRCIPLGRDHSRGDLGLEKFAIGHGVRDSTPGALPVLRRSLLSWGYRRWLLKTLMRRTIWLLYAKHWGASLCLIIIQLLLSYIRLNSHTVCANCRAGADFTPIPIKLRGCVTCRIKFIFRRLGTIVIDGSDVALRIAMIFILIHVIILLFVYQGRRWKIIPDSHIVKKL